MASDGNDDLPPPPPFSPPRLARSLTIYDGYTRKPCVQCGNHVHMDNVAGCTLYPGGSMLCSKECKDSWTANHGGRDPGE